MKPHRQRRMQHRGFVIVEALVAIMIFAFGIVGLMGLQSSMTRAQSTSKLRADAAYLASEITGTMWSDMANLTQYTGTSCAAYTPCSDWTTKVAGGLPGGSGAVTVDTSTGDVLVTIRWSTPGGESHQYTAATSVVPTSHV